MAVAPALGALLALAALTPARAAAAPPASVVPGIQDVPYIEHLREPTAVRFAPDGRVFVAEKNGSILAFDGALDDTPVEVFEVRDEVYDFWDRGLLGMALDPDFATNGYMYLLYTYDGAIGQPAPVWGDFCAFPTGPGCVVSGRLIRIKVDASSVGRFDKNLITNQWCQQFASHSIGALVFGPDKKLYVSAGEGANYDDADWGQWGGTDGVAQNPCHDPFFGIDSPRNEGGALRSPGRAAGLGPRRPRRRDPTGRSCHGRRVPGNPLGSSADPNARRIIAYGLRNPFRFAFRPGSTDLYIGDVGWGTWEEINRIPVGDMTAENLGWPCYEGNGREPSGTYDVLNACKSLVPSQVKGPLYAYRHGQPAAGCDQGNSGSSISGVAFHGTGGYPPAYNGALFFADYARGCIWAMRTTTGGVPDPTQVDLISTTAPLVGDELSSGAIDMQVGPDGDLYYAFLNLNGEGAIRHLRPTGPTAALTATPNEGPAPLSVELDAGGSTGEGTRHYAWAYDGDGVFNDGTDASVQHPTFTGSRRNATVRVRVTDATGRSDDAVATVSVGNRAPAAPTISPVGNVQQWAVGDRLTFNAAASDPDGDPLTYTWTLTLQHCVTGGGCHGHPVTSQSGPSATFTTVDHEWPSHLVLRGDRVGRAAQRIEVDQPRARPRSR